MARKAALVLAAGKGTRMHSEQPKVLQTILGEPMLGHVLAALEPVFGDDIWVVTGHRADLVEKAFPGTRFVLQAEQLGTGHALMTALPALAAFDEILVINGDAPLVTSATLREFVERSAGWDLSFASIALNDPAAYGRVVRVDGHLVGIVEAKDYNENRYGAPSGEVNAGLYYMKRQLAERLLPSVGRGNRSGEYYITDLVALALDAGSRVQGIMLGNDENLLGVNSPKELAAAEALLQKAVVIAMLDAGVVLHAPETIRVSPRCVVEPGAEITGPCEMTGRCHIHANARVMTNCVLRDSEVEGFAEIRPFSHLEGAIVREGALVGPFARLRAGAEICRNAHVGDFVELKKTVLGEGAKANHLSYLGDSVIGAGTNIGAGTITCNYDGRHKYRTTIGENVFIGSNTALVAPVTVGNGALIGAGSTITKDVPDNELAVARQKQKNLGRRRDLDSGE